MNHNDEIYKEKYLRYKKKYMELKKLEQDGGLALIKGAMGAAISEYISKAEKKANSEFKSIKDGLLGDLSDKLKSKEDKQVLEKVLKDQEAVVNKSLKSIKAEEKFNKVEVEEKAVIQNPFAKKGSKPRMKKVEKAEPKKEGGYKETDYEEDILSAFEGIGDADTFSGKINKWFTKKFDESLKDIKNNLANSDTLKDATNDEDYKKLDGEKSDNLIDQINYLRNVESTFPACKKVNLEQNSKACTPEKLKALTGIEADVKQVEKEFEDANKQVEKVSLDKVKELLGNEEIETAFKKFTDELVAKKTEKLVEVAKKYGLEINDYSAESLKAAIDGLGRDYKIPEQAMKEAADDVQEGGDFYLPDFLTETPNH